MLLSLTPEPENIQLEHAWNSADRSLNFLIKSDDPLVIYRNPVPQSTDAVRGKIGFDKGLHVWGLSWCRYQRGTHAVVGVATKAASLHCVGYQSLIGSNTESWGWDLVRNTLYHDWPANPGVTYPQLNAGFTVAPKDILVILDMDAGTLSFAANGHYLGVAFCGLGGQKLYPVVSAVWGLCEIKMTYIKGLDRQPWSLMDLTLRVIRQQLGRRQYEYNEIEKLPLPSSMLRLIHR